MRANGIFSDGSLEQLHSVSINRMMCPSDAVDMESPLNVGLSYWSETKFF